MTLARLNLRLACPLRVRQLLQVGKPAQRTGSPNFPSIELRILSDSLVCFFFSLDLCRLQFPQY